MNFRRGKVSSKASRAGVGRGDLAAQAVSMKGPRLKSIEPRGSDVGGGCGSGGARRGGARPIRTRPSPERADAANAEGVACGVGRAE